MAPRTAPPADMSWMAQAACHGKPVGLFFGPDGERAIQKEAREAKARQVCAACPVRSDCGEFALESGQVGVWGGRSDEDRAAERRRRSRRQAAA